MNGASRRRSIAYIIIVSLSTMIMAAVAEPTTSPESSATEKAARRELVVAVFEWIEATNRRDFDAQAAFYPERMDAFYLWRNVSRAAVLAEKRRVFDQALEIEIDADAPQLIVEPGGASARMYFRKTYAIDGPKRDRAGVVLQELRWERQRDGWKIISERDLRVIEPERRANPPR